MLQQMVDSSTKNSLILCEFVKVFKINKTMERNFPVHKGDRVVIKIGRREL